MRSKNRGEFSLGTMVYILGFAYAIWLGVTLSQAYADRAKVESIISGLILQSRGKLSDEEMTNKIVADVKSQIGADVDPKSVIIYRTADLVKTRIDLIYISPVRLPYVNFGWDMTMEVSKGESLAGRVVF